MADDREAGGGWLPPVPPGGGSPQIGGPTAPPDLGASTQPPPGSGGGHAEHGGHGQPGQPAGYGAPAGYGQSAYGQPGSAPTAYGQPAYGQSASAPPSAQGQPGYGPQAGWGQPGYGQPYGGWQQYGGYGQNPYGSPWASTYYAQREPDNGNAIAGFIISLASIGALFFFLGLLAPISIVLSIVAIFVSRNGVKKVDRGETGKNRALGQWGFWLGIAGVVLSLLALAAWIALFLADPEAFEDEFDPENGDPATALIRAAATLARAAAALLG